MSTKTHGMYGKPIYQLWGSMIDRCENPNNPRYESYGGRGVTVCERWRNSFVDFIADMGPRPAGMTLDRIDNNKGYEPGNCRWATASEQQRNTRRNHLLHFRGETLPLITWAERMNLTPNTLLHRIRRGWPIERAVSTPTIQKGAT